MTPLQSYLKQNNISVTAFAKAFGISRSYASEIASLVYQPSLDIALDIEIWTRGKVKAREMRVKPSNLESTRSSSSV